MSDLTAYTTLAGETIHTKARDDAARLVTDYAIGSTWQRLDPDLQEQLYGLLSNQD